MIVFDKYEFEDPTRYVGGRYINLNNLTDKELEVLSKKHPGIVKLIEPKKKSVRVKKTPPKTKVKDV